MRNITAKELQCLIEYYYMIKDTENAEKYTRELEKLQAYHNRD